MLEKIGIFCVHKPERLAGPLPPDSAFHFSKTEQIKLAKDISKDLLYVNAELKGSVSEGSVN